MGKGTVMKSYASGEELIAEVRKRAELFIDEFDDVPASGLHALKDGVDRTPAQMLAYQLGWMDLLLGWERDERGARWSRPHPATGGTGSATSTAPSTSGGTTPRCPSFRRPFGRGSTALSPSWHR